MKSVIVTLTVIVAYGVFATAGLVSSAPIDALWSIVRMIVG
jgi:hypothetical protein